MNHLVLLDTNIFSFIFKQDSRALLYEPYLQGRLLALSMMTVAELFQWVAIRHWGEFRVTQLETMLAEHYTVLPIDLETCRGWGKIRAQCRQLGRPISPQDAWIAATALQYQLPLVTHNPADFEVIEGIQIITTLH